MVDVLGREILNPMTDFWCHLFISYEKSFFFLILSIFLIMISDPLDIYIFIIVITIMNTFEMYSDQYYPIIWRDWKWYLGHSLRL